MEVVTAQLKEQGRAKAALPWTVAARPKSFSLAESQSRFAVKRKRS